MFSFFSRKSQKEINEVYLLIHPFFDFLHLTPQTKQKLSRNWEISLTELWKNENGYLVVALASDSVDRKLNEDFGKYLKRMFKGRSSIIETGRIFGEKSIHDTSLEECIKDADNVQVFAAGIYTTKCVHDGLTLFSEAYSISPDNCFFKMNDCQDAEKSFTENRHPERFSNIPSLADLRENKYLSLPEMNGWLKEYFRCFD